MQTTTAKQMETPQFHQGSVFYFLLTFTLFITAKITASGVATGLTICSAVVMLIINIPKAIAMLKSGYNKYLKRKR